MKTEQEIRQMVNTCSMYRNCAACPYNPEDISRFIGNRWKGGCPNYDKKLVYAMGYGYGDVSEYKAEIERLKEVIKNYKEVLCETTQRKDDAIKWNDKIVEEYENKIKQAKIDVLNELKTYSLCDNFFKDGKWHRYVFVDDIDELCAKIKRGGKNDAEI